MLCFCRAGVVYEWSLQQSCVTGELDLSGMGKYSLKKSVWKAVIEGVLSVWLCLF